MTAKNFEQRMAALEKAASQARKFNRDGFSIMRQMMKAAAFHAGGWRAHESEASALTRALGLEMAEFKAKLAANPNEIWRATLHCVERQIASTGKAFPELYAAAIAARGGSPDADVDGEKTIGRPLGRLA